MIHDPIGDFLTRIRNAQERQSEVVELPSTNMLVSICEILKKEGFIASFEEVKEDPQDRLVVTLRYENNVPVIRDLVRVSKPGVRKYRGYRDIKPIKSGLGISIFSTPKGVITGEEAVKNRIGGEYICYIY